MVSPSVFNPVLSGLTASAASGVVPSDRNPCQGIPGSSSSPANSGRVDLVQESNPKVKAQRLLAQLLHAKNEQLGITMSQSKFEAAIAENMVDWEAADAASNRDDGQPDSGAGVPESTTPHDPESTSPHNPIVVSSPASATALQPERSLARLLASGEYAAPDLVRHVCEMQYAPLPMFSVHEM
jgi:hypothetical protein